MRDDFGVIVTCCSGDYMFAKGCCASLRYFMGDIPICVLADGQFSLENLPQLYGAKILRRANVQDPFLRSKSFGWGITKMVALWESPFEYFLLLDADTIVWGDVRKFAAFDKYDAILHDHGAWTAQQINQWFFKIDALKKFFPKFRLQSAGYANSGAMFLRRGIFDIKEYQEIRSFNNTHPGVFFPGEQGFLNFMLFNAKEQGRVRVDNKVIQYLVADHDIEEAQNKFAFTHGTPIVNGEPTVLHWSGMKPFARSHVPKYIEPMTFFRSKYLSDLGLTSSKKIEQQLLWEEKKMEVLQLIAGMIGRLKKSLKSLLATLKSKNIPSFLR